MGKVAGTHDPRYPAPGIQTLGREISVAAVSEHEAWAGVTQEVDGRTAARLVHRRGTQHVEQVLDHSTQCHRVSLFRCASGPIGAVWNAYRDRSWGIYCADDPAAPPRRVRGARGFCLDPVGAGDGATTALCWTEGVDRRLRIVLSLRDGNTWSKPHPLSAPDADAGRPAICLHDGRLAVAWDVYGEGRYGIAICTAPDTGDPAPIHWAPSRETWLRPRLCVHDGDLYVSWLAGLHVRHRRGFVDQAWFGLAARVDRRGLTYVAGGSDTPSRAVVDLREGLLPVTTQRNCTGLRRNHFLLPGTEGRLWCAWESHLEHGAHGAGGRLLGREIEPATHRVSAPRLLHDGGAGYAASAVTPGCAWVACRRNATADGCGAIALETIDLEAARRHAKTVSRDAWRSWTTQSRFRTRRLPGVLRVAEQDLDLFWADTHCHSGFSGDAEGEVDELIRYARDVAGLDAVCVTDNDYYPSKALTPAEWQLQQDWALHFTQPGRFAALPGYEYTYWGPEGVNHRILLYSGPGGTLHRRIDRDTASVEELFRRLDADPVQPLCYAHHPTYRLLDRGDDRWVEICSSWRVSMAELDFTRKQIAAGYRVGFIGSSDTHRAVPGLGGALTGIYAEALTPSSLLEAMRRRRTVATQGFRLWLDVCVNGVFIGGEGVTADAPVLEATVRAPRRIECIDIVRDGALVDRRRPGSREVSLSYRDKKAAVGVHSYFLQIKLVGSAGFNMIPRRNSHAIFTNDGPCPGNLARRQGCYAWSSPIWIERIGRS